MTTRVALTVTVMLPFHDHFAPICAQHVCRRAERQFSHVRIRRQFSHVRNSSLMSEPVEQWIKRIPELSDADIRNLQQALDKEKGQRRDKYVLRLFRKKCIHAGRNPEDDEISDFSEESPGSSPMPFTTELPSLLKRFKMLRQKEYVRLSKHGKPAFKAASLLFH